MSATFVQLRVPYGTGSPRAIDSVGSEEEYDCRAAYLAAGSWRLLFDSAPPENPRDEPSLRKVGCSLVR